MCLYPRFIKNRKYTPTKKNNYNPPVLTDWRVKYVPIGCGNCIECRKQKAREWQVRLAEEIKKDEKKYFITLSFAPEELKKLAEELTKETKKKITNIECNAVATFAFRRFLERYRKQYKKSAKHWFITELGDNYTERIHLHGILWTNHIEEIEKLWKYGNIWIGDYITEKTINYIVKYITKIDEKHKTYRPIILCSAALGATYINTYNAEQAAYAGELTKDYYKLNNGQKIAQPIYYRNKIYSEEERELLWLQKIDKHQIYILGVPHEAKTEKQLKELEKIRKQAQKKNIELGYGDLSKEWKEEKYNITLKMLNNSKTQRQGRESKK